MNYFAIHIEPTAPVVLGRRLNLDAILAYLLLQRLRAQGIDEVEALRRAHTEIPLGQSHSVFMASSAFVPRTRITKRSIFGSLKRHVAAIPDFDTVIEKDQKERANSRDFEKIEKRYQTIYSTYEEYDLHRPNMQVEGDHEWGIWFAAYGDRAAIEELLRDLRYIGKKRTPIRPPEFYDAQPGAVPGLLGHDGTVLRPVPCSTDLAPMRFTRAHERSRPPYWRSSLATDPVLCYVPPQTMWPNIRHIKRIIGVA